MITTPSSMWSYSQRAEAYLATLAVAVSLPCIGGCTSVDSGRPEKKRITAAPYHSSPEVTSVPVQGCPNSFTPQKPIEPELCPWLLSFDLIAFATVESRTTPSTYAVETDTARRIQQAVKELGLDEQFPWVDSAASTQDPIVVVDSCPVGVAASLDDWRLIVRDVPSLVVGIHIDAVLRGVMSDVSTDFYVGWEQRLRWSGPKWSDENEWAGTQLAPGSVIGLPLSYDHSGKNLLLAGEQPFTVDAEGRLRMNSITCPPLVPKAFHGATPADLTRQLDECSADESAVLEGNELREARVRRVSAPLRFPPTAAFCNISFHMP